MKLLRRAGMACAALALCAGMPARAGCWSAAEREAAQVREFQTLLMVASLRCSAVGIDIVADYNGFVRSARETLEAANLRIKAHFAAEGGSQADYDRFATSLANRYGDGQTDAATCAEAAENARAAAMPNAELARLAAVRLFPRALPGDGCAPALTIAAAVPPAASAATVVTLAPPAPAVTRLPDEVVAALAVMARYSLRPVEAAAAVPPAPAAPAPTELASLVH